MKSLTLSLKKASRELVEAAGGQTAAATRCRLGQSKLSEAVSVFHADRFLPVDAVGDLEDIAPRSAAWPQVTRELALRQGFVLVPLPASAIAPMGCEKHLAIVHRETTDVVQTLLASLEGGVSPAEANRIRKEIAEAQQALANLDGELRAVLADTS